MSRLKCNPHQWRPDPSQFDGETSRYRIDMPMSGKILAQFNACAAQTNIYPGSFVVKK
jgi:hypothetical protein